MIRIYQRLACQSLGIEPCALVGCDLLLSGYAIIATNAHTLDAETAECAKDISLACLFWGCNGASSIHNFAL